VFVINYTKTIQFKRRRAYIPLPEICNHPFCTVGILKRKILLSPAQQGSGPVFTFITLLGTKPLIYDKFAKELFKQLGLETGYCSHSFRRRWTGFILQIDIPGEMIKLMGNWRSDCYERRERKNNVNIC